MGIGFEIEKKLKDDQKEIFVGSRTHESLTDDPEIHYLQLDVTEDFSCIDGLPEIVRGLVYCPGTIVLKPFQRLKIVDNG